MRDKKFQAAFEAMNAAPLDVLTKEERDLRWLPIEAVQVNEDLFQPRNLRDAETRVGSETQVRELLDNLENGTTLDAVTVWRCGGVWYCVDGYHRLLAYQRWQANGTTKAGRRRSRIPVTVVEGRLDDIIAGADKENFKNKLNVAQHDKLDRALEWVKLGKETAWILERVSVSRRTICSMKSTLARLKVEHPSVQWDGWSWPDMLKALNQCGEGKGDDDAMWTKRFRDQQVKTFGQRPAKHRRPFVKMLWEVYGEETAGAFADLMMEEKRRRTQQANPFEEGPIL